MDRHVRRATARPGGRRPPPGKSEFRPLHDIWPFMEGEPGRPIDWVADCLRTRQPCHRRAFLSPADPTLDGLTVASVRAVTPSSYSSNLWAFDGRPPFPDGIRDGTSSTLAYAERYALLPPTRPGYDLAWAYYEVGGWAEPLAERILGNYPRRATFADRGNADVVPVTTNGVTRSSVPGTTFLARPAFQDDYGHVLQSPYPTGLQVAFFDGSVRFLRAGIAEAAFWGMVTRDGGEVVSD